MTKEEARIDWSRDAGTLWRQIRAFNPSPGAVARLGQMDFKLWQARIEPGAAGTPGEILRADSEGLLVACGKDALWLLQLQKAGGKRVSAREFLQGFHVAPGESFDS